MLRDFTFKDKDKGFTDGVSRHFGQQLDIATER